MRAQIRRRSLVTLIVVVFTTVSAVGAVVSRAFTSSGCRSAEGPIAESQRFTPAEDMLTQPPDPPINPLGDPAIAVPEDARVLSIGGLPLRWATGSASGSVYQYFLDKDVDSELTVSEFVVNGGVQFGRDPVVGEESHASYLLATLGERAVPVQVGDFEAALTWADPQANGVRTHNLYWSDGKYNYELIADRSPETLVTLGREVVCK